ncbi:recombinase family protein [Aquamicrobium terrae]|uniref:Resolvase/invertase-type recombinase catalytic domain-containing protein n=1 Tax=Aquamicrobium terrae TaxID=1324945 RepID=A0ABV2N7B3_9HYPH
MLRIALYARYSSEDQRDASIEDQLRQCRERAEREGWTVVETYSDRAISGSSMIRAGIQALMADAQAGRFDMALPRRWTASAAIRKTWPPCSSACVSPASPSSLSPKARSTSFMSA